MSADNPIGPATGRTPDPHEALRTLVQGITLAQGNIFIKELLRRKNIPIGATKAEFEKHMLTAIDTGKLRHADLDDWLDEVEGWGDQHIYLYRIPPEIAGDPLWGDPDRVRRKVKQADLEQAWEAPTSHVFPEEPQLTCITFAKSTLRLVWHESSPSWVPEPERDYETTIDGDRYQFRAFREQARRALTRFEMRLGEGLAAMFIPVRINAPEHQNAVTEVEKTVGRLLPFDVLQRGRIIIAEVIKNMDQANYASQAGLSAEVITQSTRLTSSGAWVEFSSVSEDRGYGESPAIRDVRRAIRRPQLQAFSGSNGVLKFYRTGNNPLSREVKVQLYGNQRRIRIWRRLTATDVWFILGVIARHT